MPFFLGILLPEKATLKISHRLNTLASDRGVVTYSDKLAVIK